MVQANLNLIKRWKSVPVQELGAMLQEQGFRFNKIASFEDHRVFTSNDGNINIVLYRNDGKVYTNGDNKNPVHAFSVIA